MSWSPRIKSKPAPWALLLAAFLLLPFGCSEVTNRPEARSEAPLFRFLQINDTHVDSRRGPGAYVGNAKRLRWVVDAANAGRSFPRPDFVIGVGDLIEGGDLERLGPDMRLFTELIKPLQAPFYPVMGNHEVVQREGDPVYEQCYRQTFGNERVNYTFMRGGVMFVALNNSGAGCLGTPPSVIKARNEWLEKVLDADKDCPKIIFCHVPLIPLREEKVLAESFGFRSYYDLDGGTLSVIERHADTVVAILSGHLHLTAMAERNGICHVSVTGTACYPCDVATYTVFADRIEAAVRQLPPDLVAHSYDIHGKPRHKQDFTDATHKTHDEYVLGLPGERTFTIPLRGEKRPKPGA